MQLLDTQEEKEMEEDEKDAKQAGAQPAFVEADESESEDEDEDVDEDSELDEVSQTCILLANDCFEVLHSRFVTCIQLSKVQAQLWSTACTAVLVFSCILQLDVQAKLQGCCIIDDIATLSHHDVQFRWPLAPKTVCRSTCILFGVPGVSDPGDFQKFSLKMVSFVYANRSMSLCHRCDVS